MLRELAQPLTHDQALFENIFNQGPSDDQSLIWLRALKVYGMTAPREMFTVAPSKTTSAAEKSRLLLTDPCRVNHWQILRVLNQGAIQLPPGLESWQRNHPFNTLNRGAELKAITHYSQATERETELDHILKTIEASPEKIDVLVMVGLPGCGKSTLAQRIAKQTGAVYLSSDITRDTEQYLASTMQALEQSSLAYERMWQETLQILGMKSIKTGIKVVLDATHLDPKRRQTLENMTFTFSGRKNLAYLLVLTDKSIIKNRKKQHMLEEAQTIGTEKAQANLDKWGTVYDFFEAQLETGDFTWPVEDYSQPGFQRFQQFPYFFA